MKEIIEQHEKVMKEINDFEEQTKQMKDALEQVRKDIHKLAVQISVKNSDFIPQMCNLRNISMHLTNTNWIANVMDNISESLFDALQAMMEYAPKEETEDK